MKNSTFASFFTSLIFLAIICAMMAILLDGCSEPPSGAWESYSPPQSNEQLAPTGSASWEASPSCELLVDQQEGYFTGHDLYDNVPGIQVLIPVNVRSEENWPQKVSWYFNGDLSGYTGGVNGYYSVVLTLPETSFVSVAVVADNCPLVIWNADINWKYQGDEDSDNLLPPPPCKKVHPKPHPWHHHK